MNKYLISLDSGTQTLTLEAEFYVYNEAMSAYEFQSDQDDLVLTVNARNVQYIQLIEVDPQREEPA